MRFEDLDDYVTGTMADADSFEEEMFGALAHGEGAEARWFERFHQLMAWIGRGDFLIRGATAEDVEGLRKTGLKVHLVELVAKTAYRKVPEAEIVVTHVPVDVRGYDDVEATIENPDGTVLHTFRGCLPDPATGNLYAICAAPLAEMAWGGGPRVARVTGAKPDGRGNREEIAVYELTPVRDP